jgi:hypothetical protein
VHRQYEELEEVHIEDEDPTHCALRIPLEEFQSLIDQ